MKEHDSKNIHIHQVSVGKNLIYTDMTKLEIGMYVLLIAFCLAIGVFIISCVVYASKFRPITVEVVSEDMGINKDPSEEAKEIWREPRRSREPTTNARDWVWLGRSTMDQPIIHHNPQTRPEISAPIRITSNPISTDHDDHDDIDEVQKQMSKSDNDIESKENKNLNTATYTKRDRRSYQRFVLK